SVLSILTSWMSRSPSCYSLFPYTTLFRSINKDSFLLFAALALSGVLIVCSSEAKEGALYGAALAQRVIIPSLLPLLILFNFVQQDRKSTRLNSSHVSISYAVFCLKKKID